MSTAVATPTRHTPLGHLTFPRVVRSEWIKFRTLRSTFWSYAIVLVLGVGMTALVAFTFPESQASQMTDAVKADFVTSTFLYGVFFGQLIVAVLGVLVISGEYSTGMIRSSFAAVPRRTPVFVAKSIVLFASSFVVGTVSAVTGYAIAEPALSAKGFPVDITQADTVWAILGAGAYLGLVSVFALGLGALLRSAAGGIAAALGIVFLLPIIVTILRNQMSTVEWIGEVPQYLISNAGEAMAGSSLTTLGPWQNVLVVVVWTAVSFFAGAIIMKRRDA